MGTGRPPGVSDSSSGGGQEKPIDPHPTWDGSGGAVAATSAAQAGQDAPPPSPPRGSHMGIKESQCPLPPHRRGRSGQGGGGEGWCSRGAPCRPCAMSTRPQHASHARGTLLQPPSRGASQGVGGRTTSPAGPEGGATAASGRVTLRRVGARARPRDHGGGGGGGQQGRGRRRRPRAAHKAQVRATGGPRRRAHSHTTASFRRAATHRGAGGGRGQASRRL